MAIWSSVVKKVEDNSEYPVLKKHKKLDLIVLFVKKREGIAVIEDTQKTYGIEVGNYSFDWDENVFEVFNDAVTLQNK